MQSLLYGTIIPNESFCLAIFFLNRCPNRAAKGKFAWEAWQDGKILSILANVKGSIAYGSL